MADKKLYTPKEVQQIFSISRPTVNDWSKKGVLKKISVPGQRRVYITSDSVDAIVNQKC